MVGLILFIISQNCDMPVNPQPLSKIEVVNRQSKDNISPLLPITFLIKIYQTTLSNQQEDVCNFTPSCSEYAYEALKKYNIMGILMIFDRLQRCSPSAWRYQNVFYKTQETKNRGTKLFDPPDNNSFFINQ